MNTLPGVEPDIDYDALVTEDHKPFESIFIEKQSRLLTDPLYASWAGPGDRQPFLVLVNVGWFYQATTPAVVPDCLLSLGVTCPPDLHVKQGHSYYQWLLGKQPDVLIEIISDRKGGEESVKKNLYARLGVPYYAVFDPEHLLSDDTLRTYELVARKYRLGDAGPWTEIGLGLRLWEGRFEGVEDVWLRWCDANGQIIPTGEERAAILAERATQADERIRELEAEVRRLKGEGSPKARRGKKRPSSGSGDSR
jgi:hypothetical protein